MNDRQPHPHELISAMLDGETDARERAVVDAHLQECPECRDLAGDLTALGEVLADDPVPPVPAGLAERIGWSLRSQTASRRRPGGVRWSGPRTLAALGGVAAAGILAVLVVREGGAPFLDRSPLPPAANPAPAENKAAAERERDEAQEKLKSLGYAATGGAGRDSATRYNRGDGRADGAIVVPPRSPQAGGGGSRMGSVKGDILTYAPSPTGTASSGPLGGASTAQAAPAPPSPYLDTQEEAGRASAKTGTGTGVTAEAGTPAGAPAPRERAKKASDANALSAPADKSEMAKETVAEGFVVMEKEKDAGAGGTGPTAKDAPAADEEDAGKQAVAGASGPRSTGMQGVVAPPQAAPKPSPAPDSHAAREQAAPLLSQKPKVLDKDSLTRLAIPACRDAEGAKPVTRWAAASAPLLLRRALSDAEPDLAALAARLGGSICEERASGVPPLIILDAPAARWGELREALAVRIETPGSLTPPPAEGFNVVRVVLRPR